MTPPRHSKHASPPKTSPPLAKVRVGIDLDPSNNFLRRVTLLLARGRFRILDIRRRANGLDNLDRRRTLPNNERRGRSLVRRRRPRGRWRRSRRRRDHPRWHAGARQRALVCERRYRHRNRAGLTVGLHHRARIDDDRAMWQRRRRGNQRWWDIAQCGALENRPWHLRHHDLLTLGRHGHHLLGLGLGRLRRVGLQDDDGLGPGALLLRRLRHEDRLRLTLDQGGLRLGQDVVLTGHTSGHDVLQLTTRTLLEQHLYVCQLSFGKQFKMRD